MVVGCILGRRPGYLFQNPSEAALSRALLKRLPPPDYHLLNHLTLRTSDGTTQIDHVLISRFGVFVIETKSYKGWIFADPTDRNWIQVLYRTRFRFQNPIHQNYRHMCAVRELFDFLPSDAITSIVVFAGSARFKTPIPDGVFRINDFLSYLEGKHTEVMSLNRVQFCVGRLETTRLSVSRRTDVEHIQHVRGKYGSYD
jgi:hypothetical protein